MNGNKNYYDILEISKTSSILEIQEAYNKAKNAYSGDSAALYSLLSETECNEILTQIEEAYSVLGNAEKRKAYDKARGFNLENTESGYQQKILNKDELKPKNSLLNETLVSVRKDPLQDESDSFTYTEFEPSRAEALVSKVSAFKKFSLKFEKNYEFEQEIESATEFTGAFLKSIREYKQVSIERMSEMTRISKTQIRNIEDEAYDSLPAEAYARGFVYQYAKCLKLNPDLVATSYIHLMKQARK